jgi:hypothetical protein
MKDWKAEQKIATRFAAAIVTILISAAAVFAFIVTFAVRDAARWISATLR